MNVSNFRTDAEVKAYYTSLQNWFQEHNKTPGLVIDFSAYLKRPQMVTAAMRKLLDREGRIYVETIITTMDLVDRFMRDIRGIGLFGLVQSAKTHTQILSVLISCVTKYLKDGRITHPFFFIPNQKGTYLSQFRNKYRDLYMCIKNTRIEYDGNDIMLRDYVELAHQERNTAVRNISPHAKEFFGTSQWNAYFKEKIELERDEVLILPMSPRLKDAIQVVLAGTVMDQKHRAIFDRDEAHSAVARGSVTDQIMAQTRIMEQSIYDLVNKNTAGDAQFMAVSATNWGSMNLEKVALCVSADYCGIDFAYQEGEKYIRVAEQWGVTIKEPEIVSMSKFGTHCIEDEVFQWIRPYWYADEEGFLKHMEIHNLQRLFGGHGHYKKKCALSVASAINYLFSDPYGKGHKGMLIRFCNDNREMDNFINDLMPHLDRKRRVKIIKEYGEKHDSIEDLLILHKVEPGDFYVIFATAGARMSDSFPRECGYGIDFTYRSTTLGALIQGVLGRMSGYFKDPVVVISDDNTDSLNEYILNGYFPPPGAKLTNGVCTAGRRSYETFRARDYRDDPVMCTIIRNLQGMLDKYAKPKEKNQRWQYSLGKDVPVDFMAMITPEGFKHIEGTYAKMRLLKPGERDQLNRIYYKGDNGVVATIRAEGGGRHRHFGGRPGDMLADGSQRIRGIIRIRIDLVGRYQTPKAVVTGFDLAVYQTAKSKINIGETVPAKIRRI